MDLAEHPRSAAIPQVARRHPRWAWLLCACPLLFACRMSADEGATSRAQQRTEAAVDQNDPTASAQADADSDAVASRVGAPGLPAATDRERAALGMLSVADQFQVDAARLALDREIDPRVTAFAELQQREHAAHRGELDGWLPDTGNAQVQARLRDGQQTLAALRGADAHAFQAAYIETMVSTHAQTLAWLQDEMIPSARTPGIRAQLEQARAQAERHLQAARRLPGAAGLPHSGALP